MTHDRDPHRNDESIVELTRVAGIVEAEAFLAELKGQGIQATFNENDLGGMRPNISYSQGVSIYVFESDVEAALRVGRDLGFVS